MDMIDKATKVAKDVSNSAKNLGTSIYTATKEQSEIAGMKVQKSVVERRLQELYATIGKRYVDFIKNSEGDQPFDIADILEEMQPDLDKLEELNASLKEKELAAKEAAEAKNRQKVQDQFDAYKAKLDRALGMEIIDQDDYDFRLAKASKKLENYDEIRKIDMQLEIGIITEEEHDEKISQLLE